MSTIGTGVAASVAAQTVAERQAVASKATQEREAERLKRELRDKFSPSTATVEESRAAASVEGDEESPADAKDQQRHSDRQPHQAADAAAKLADGGHLDVQA